MILLIQLLIGSILSFSQESQKLILASGQTHRINLSPVRDVWVQNSKVIKAQAEPGKVTIKAQSPGSTILRVNNTPWSIEVISAEDYSLYLQLQNKIKSMMGLSLKIKDGQIELVGNLLKIEDWITISEMHTSSGRFHFCAKMNDLVKKTSTHYFGELLKNNNLPILAIQMQPCARISIKEGSFSERIEKILKPYGVEVQKNPTAIEIAPMVRVHITIAEVRKENGKKLGIQWPTSFTASMIEGAQSLDLLLNFMEREGSAKVLAQPNLLSRSGSEAEFMAGGEFPLKVVSTRRSHIEWKKYGILLKIKPLADFSGNMSIALETEISSIDESKSIDGIPGMLTNKIQNHFDLSESKTIVLSGLIKSEDAKSSQGLLGLTQIPIIGRLFSSEDFKENRTELIILVKPELVNTNEMTDSTFVKNNF